MKNDARIVPKPSNIYPESIENQATINTKDIEQSTNSLNLIKSFIKKLWRLAKNMVYFWI